MKKVTNKKMTIDDLAVIVAKGFAGVDNKFDEVNKKIDKEIGEVKREIAEVKKDITEVKENLASTRRDVLSMGDNFTMKLASRILRPRREFANVYGKATILLNRNLLIQSSTNSQVV